MKSCEIASREGEPNIFSVGDRDMLKCIKAMVLFNFLGGENFSGGVWDVHSKATYSACAALMGFATKFLLP